MKNSITLIKSAFVLASILFASQYSSAQCHAEFSVSQTTTGATGTNPGTVVPYSISITDLSSLGGSTGTGLSADTNVTYNWHFGDGDSSSSPNPVHSYSGTGPYILCLTISSPATAFFPACTDTYCDTVEADTNGLILKNAQGLTLIVGEQATPTGIIKSKLKHEKVTVFTSRYSFNLELESLDAKSAIVNIIDLTGKNLITKPILIDKGTNQFRVNSSELNSGIYFVNIIAENSVIATQKIFKP